MENRSCYADEPLAYFITWTTYGSWLPGDERGWWHAGRFQQPDKLNREMATARMKESEFCMSPFDRQVVEATVRRHCKIRGWPLPAIKARTNHVHVAVAAPGYPPESVRDQLKAWCTRRLKASNPGRKRFWTEGGNCRSINHEDNLETVMNYILEAQDRKGLEA